VKQVYSVSQAYIESGGKLEKSGTPIYILSETIESTRELLRFAELNKDRQVLYVTKQLP